MSSFRNNQSLPERETTSHRNSEISSNFKRRHVHGWKLLFPRRYVVALLLFTLLLIQAWRNINIVYTLAHIIILGEESAKIKYSSIAHWTIEELDNYRMGALLAEVFAQMPGAILIFSFSSHKFLLVSVTASSIIHMLTPVALNHHSISLLFVLVAQNVIAAPIIIAVMTTWKDWAPPAERTKLVLFSLYGIFLGAAATTFYGFVFQYVTTDASYYLSGIAGIIWALFWFNMTSDTPQNDPLISVAELIYLENSLPSDHLQKIQVTDIPWKSIILSKPVFVICLLFFKMACSIEIITICGTIFTFHLGENHNPLHIFVPFLAAFITIIPLTAVVADYLIKRFSRKTLYIRQIFVCGGFFLQCVFLFGTLANSEVTKTLFFMTSYSIFVLSVSGFITIPLDLSPRYCAIIAGIIFTVYSIGFICMAYFIEATISVFHLSTISWIFLFDGTLSLLSIIFFMMWGDTEEQLWSLTLPTSPRINDYRSYPKPEDEDDINLVA